MEGVVDRLVLLREDGEVMAARILGYKTDAMEPEDAASLQDRIRHYAPQINAYRRAVSGLYGLDPAQVEGGLVFLDTGMVLEVPAGDSPSPR
jgi:ATP-dependent exoDNAse (exonuclease V) beta subunit